MVIDSSVKWMRKGREGTGWCRGMYRYGIDGFDELVGFLQTAGSVAILSGRKPFWMRRLLATNGWKRGPSIECSTGMTRR